MPDVAQRDDYTCEACGGTFTKGWSDESASTEAREQFGTDLTQDPTMAIVCDDCYAILLRISRMVM